MGLADLFRDLGRSMLTPGGIFDDIPVSATYYYGETGNAAMYDPVTGAVTRNEHPGVSISGVFTDPKIDQIDNVNILPDDRMFLVSAYALTVAGLAARIKPGDRIVYSLQTWEVISVKTDPVMAVYIFQLRRP